ncbi:uncharacterized protein LOC133534338 [Cydia pomonella]|uniref:uncharacterized protein LOC133534338 n=1 Tax=Cydia pomonella TaxID=82600 RepID=UPI002ADE904D|nr:uncharacterized protein LOC133534338 [Cydia pomonella]
MESVLTPPLPFKFEENVTNMAFGSLCESWEKWKNGFQIYVKACELNKKTEEIQMNIFLHVVGEQCREIIEQSTTKCTTLAALIGQVDNHFKAKKNVTVERHRFFTRQQGEHESIDQYVFELRKLAQSCEFGNLNDGLIKDRLVCGIVSAAIRERLLREDDLTLNKALEICRAAIVSKMYSEDIKRECTSETKGNEVCAVANKEVYELNRSGAKVEAKSSRGMSSGRGWRGRGWAHGAGRSGAPGAAGPAGAQHRAPYAYRGGRCGQCGGVHKKYDCPAYGRSCMKCSRPNHFARMCRVYMVEESEDQVNNIKNRCCDCCEEWNTELKINNVPVCFKLDTGAEVNILPKRYLRKLGISSKDLSKTNTRLTEYSGAGLNVIGKIFLRVRYKNNLYVLEFKIVDLNSAPILGRYACKELNLVRRVMSVEQSNDNDPDFIKKFSDVFHGIGCLPGEYKIQLKSDAVPVIHAPRKLPFAIKDAVKNKLLEMEAQGIIAKVEGPSDWVSSITVVKKSNGDLRICLDPKELNNAIKREHFRLPTIDEIVSNLSGARYFSTLDASSGFWQVRLDETTDTLSRAYEPSASVEHAGREALHDEVCAVERALAGVANDHFTDHQFVALQKQTDTDDELVQLRKCILKGWPDDRKDLVDVLRPYWTYRDEITVAQGIVRAPDRWGDWI